MNQSRTKNSILNFAITFMAGILLPVFGLVKYSLFINFYGSAVNGIQIAMESVIAIINIFEICFSLAFRQLLFEPLARDDKEEVNSIYSKGLKIFRITGTVFLLVGFVIGICFPLFNDSPFGYLETIVYFIILVIPYGISYFLMGPNLVLIADQKEYKINIWIQGIAIFRMFLMIGAIVLKLPVVIIFVIESCQILVANIISRTIALKHYPWLTEVKTTVRKSKSLIDNIKYTFVQRMETVASSNVDTFFISVFLNYANTSIFGAYTYIIDSVTKIINKALESTLNSFGNLFSTSKDSYEVFLEFFEFVAFIASLIAVCVCAFFNDFISIWLRSADTHFEAELSLVIILSFNIFYMILREAYIIPRDAYGLFKDAVNNAVSFTIAKLVLGIILIRYCGIYGAIVSTLLVNLIIDFTYNPRLVCNKLFNGKTFEFYTKIAIRTVLCFAVGISVFILKQRLFGEMILSFTHFFIAAAVVGSIALLAHLVIYGICFKSFRNFVARVINVFERKVKND